MKNEIRTIFGPDGKNHMEFKAGGMSFVDGKAYTKVGNMARGSDGSTYIKIGNTIMGSNGKMHQAFGDNPTFLV